MRVKLQRTNLEKLFSNLREGGHKINELSRKLGVAPRTMSDWQRGKTSMPQNSFIAMASLVNIPTSTLSEVPKRFLECGAGRKNGRGETDGALRQSRNC